MQKNKYFYYSEDDCKYVEVRRGFVSILGKVALTLLLAVGLTTLILYKFGDTFSSSRAKAVAEENQKLQGEVKALTDRLARLNEHLTHLSQSDNELRKIVDLPQISDDQKNVGVGGKRLSLATAMSVSDASEKVLAASNDLIAKLDRQVKLQEDSYKEILAKYEVNQKFFACFPAIKPVEGEVFGSFGMRMHPIYRVLKFHSGVDMTASLGTPVSATGDGTVESVGMEGGYGKCIVISHGFGYKTLYGHLSQFKVREGQKVKRGEVIALSGNTGVSAGPHVHYEVIKNGIKENPMAYLFDDISPKTLAAAQDTVAGNFPAVK
jgi:murein DD-endopeptidase MepM/ murein hydrolase activator NlpD